MDKGKARLLHLRVTRQGVVIREGDQVDLIIPRRLRQLLGREQGVGMQGVTVQLGTNSAHNRSSSTVRRTVQGRVMTACALTPTRHAPGSIGPSAKP